MQRQRSAQSGFSMVELLVAVFILAVGLLGLAELQITAMKANSQGATLMAATSIAQSVIEEISAANSDDPRLDTSGTWATGVEVAGAGAYDVTYTVENNHNGVTNLCRIIVTVQSVSEVSTVFGRRLRTVQATTLKRVT